MECIDKKKGKFYSKEKFRNKNLFVYTGHNDIIRVLAVIEMHDIGNI